MLVKATNYCTKTSQALALFQLLQLPLSTLLAENSRTDKRCK